MNERGDEDENERDEDRRQDVIDPVIAFFVSRGDERWQALVLRRDDRFVSDANV